MKILIIDDDETIIGLAKKLYDNHPEVVSVRCANTEEVMKVIGKHHPVDVIFLDHNFEDGGIGLDIVRGLKLQPKPPIIFSTSEEARDGDLHDQYASLGVEWVGKPREVMTEKINEFLER